jgi:quercetin dioxygenase-like cupin family protein
MLIKVDNLKFNDKKVNVEVIISVDEFRLVHFYLKAGQKVGLHSSKSHVLTTVLKGKGKFFIENEENYKILSIGDAIYYQPMQPHGFESIEDMVVQAIISPNPSSKIELKR